MDDPGVGQLEPWGDQSSPQRKEGKGLAILLQLGTSGHMNSPDHSRTQAEVDIGAVHNRFLVSLLDDVVDDNSIFMIYAC